MSWASDIKDVDFSEYTFENVSQNPNIQLHDSDDKLLLYSYKDGITEDHTFERLVRGMVFEKENKKLISVTYGYTPFYDVNDEKLNKILNLNILRDCAVNKSYEGSILKMFYFDKWYLTTHKKLDAFKSKRSSDVSLGETFFKVLDVSKDEFESKLDKDYEYIFLLQNTMMNRRVCSIETPKIYHVGTMHNLQTVNSDLGLPVPEVIKVTSLTELKKTVENIDYKEAEGVIITLPDMTKLKIYNHRYHEYSELRGNEHSVIFRYLQIRNTIGKDDYYQLYSDKKNEFDNIENKVVKIINILHNIYVQRHIYRREMYVLPVYNAMDKMLHTHFINGKSKNTGVKITEEFTKNFVNNLDTQTLLRLIKTVQTL